MDNDPGQGKESFRKASQGLLSHWIAVKHSQAGWHGLNPMHHYRPLACTRRQIFGLILPIFCGKNQKTLLQAMTISLQSPHMS
jgi:hypothetical protein